ncbi:MULTISPECIES: hypothetical protein [Moorena]|uniref:Uncharacterized protein n=1 Tax=Moorena producens 3L TaxID=489825 RepID=F4XWM7_9CYAN|nr:MULTISPECIES: hypothetical protein [Moorena]EGJ30987.1 hypothetical protein LYNGBM3L_44590 [Moorena producens 3L]NEP66037.1 hypothetical protein [Moorena sp. SIO3A5]OLT68200.1 hypothetical protein BI334_27140 [Moorena producens 3L]
MATIPDWILAFNCDYHLWQVSVQRSAISDQRSAISDQLMRTLLEVLLNKRGKLWALTTLLKVRTAFE